MLRMRAELLVADPCDAARFPPHPVAYDTPFDTVVTAVELHIRHFSINDRDRDDRAAWVSAIFPDTETYPLTDFERTMSPARGTAFDVLIMGGNDIVRIRDMLHAYEAVLHNVVKIVLGCGLGPSRRAEALAAGFDDVFDVVRMRPEEAVARLRAIHRRYALNAVRLREEQDMASACGAALADQTIVLDCVSIGAQVSRQEGKLLNMLVSKRGDTVRYIALQNALRTYHEPPSFEHLKVLVCTLRKKLRPGVRIVATINQGYRIEFAKTAVRSAA